MGPRSQCLRGEPPPLRGEAYLARQLSDHDTRVRTLAAGVGGTARTRRVEKVFVSFDTRAGQRACLHASRVSALDRAIWRAVGAPPAAVRDAGHLFRGEVTRMDHWSQRRRSAGAGLRGANSGSPAAPPPPVNSTPRRLVTRDL